MKRIFLIVLDSFGVGEAPDANLFGDVGSNTLRSITESKEYKIENLKKLGLYNIDEVNVLEKYDNVIGSYGKMEELSKGKDTTTGHWEMMGIIGDKPMPTFPNGFPEDFIKTFEDKKFNFEPLWEFECVVVMDKRHSLSDKDSISLNDLTPYIELVHGDNIIPYLTGENTQINSANDDSSQKIYIFERGSQFDLLQNIPESYMMVAPIPNDVLESHNLVQKRLSSPGQAYKDVLVYRSSYNLTDLDNLLLRKIKDVINETSH